MHLIEYKDEELNMHIDQISNPDYELRDTRDKHRRHLAHLMRRIVFSYSHETMRVVYWLSGNPIVRGVK